MLKLTFLALLLAAVSCQVSCGTGETDGRVYSNSSPSPIQGKMGVSHKRVKANNAPVVTEETAPKTIESDGLIGAFTAPNDEPPGLLDRNVKPDPSEESGDKYWLYGQHSPSPVQGKMGVRVSRRKL